MIVKSSGNERVTRPEIYGYPALFGDSGNTVKCIGDPLIVDMILVGASENNGHRTPFSQDARFLGTYARGRKIEILSAEGGFR